MNAQDYFDDWWLSEIAFLQRDERDIMLSRRICRPIFLAGFKAAEQRLQDSQKLYDKAELDAAIKADLESREFLRGSREKYACISDSVCSGVDDKRLSNAGYADEKLELAGGRR